MAIRKRVRTASGPVLQVIRRRPGAGKTGCARGGDDRNAGQAQDHLDIEEMRVPSGRLSVAVSL